MKNHETDSASDVARRSADTLAVKVKARDPAMPEAATPVPPLPQAEATPVGEHESPAPKPADDRAGADGERA